MKSIPTKKKKAPIMPTPQSPHSEEVIKLLVGNRREINVEEDLSPKSPENSREIIELLLGRALAGSAEIDEKDSSTLLGLSEEEKELAMAIQESIKFSGEKEYNTGISGSQPGFFYSAKEEKEKEKEKEKEETNTSVYSSRFWNPELTKSNGLPYYLTEEEELERALLASLEGMPRNNSNC